MERIGRYEIVEQVGRGSMGIVYRAQDTVLEREVALKLLWEDFCDDESALARFQREARAVARLTHRNIVTLYELAQQEDGRPYIAMEFLRGAPLDRRLREEPPLTLVQKVDVISQLCAGLHFAHEQGVVHRDVKPANIWVLPDTSVKLLDFGIARLASSSITRDGNIVGTASYMAPEQIEGGAVDGRTDVFAAGVVLYELLAGHKPFEADSPTGVIAKIIRGDREMLDPARDHLPPALVAAVDRALARAPADRFPTAAEFGATLAQIRQALERQAGTPLDATMVVPRAGAFTAPAEDLAIGPRPTVPADHDLALNPSPGADSRAGMPTAPPGPAPRSIAGGATARRTLGWVPVLSATALIAAVLVGGLVWTRGSDEYTDAGGQSVPTAEAVPRQPAEIADAAGPADAAPVAPPAVESRELWIESDPAGAWVSVAGRRVPGETPLTLTVDADGPWPQPIIVEKRGYDTAKVELTDALVAAGRLSVPLRQSARQVRLVATGDYAFEVLDGARSLSPPAGEHSLTLTEGQQLRLRAPSVFLDQRVVVRAAAGGVMRVTAAGLGSISVRAVVENCDMRLDGARTDQPPVHQKPVAAGEHTVELLCADGEARRQRVEVREGANTTVLFRQ